MLIAKMKKNKLHIRKMCFVMFVYNIPTYIFDFRIPKGLMNLRIEGYLVVLHIVAAKLF